MGRTAVIVSQRLRSHQQRYHNGSIDVHTGAGNFFNGVTPNQDIVAVFSGGDDGGSGWFGDRGCLTRKRAFFAALASEAWANPVAETRELWPWI